MLAIAGKDGRVHGIDRTTQTPVFNTPGTRVENENVPLDSETWRYVCPGLQGGAMFNGAAYNPVEGMLYVGMSDHCAWYVRGAPYKDWSAAARYGAPKGWITALDGETGAVRWQYHADAQVLAGLVPTKSGLLFAGDTHGNLLAFRAKDGSLLHRIDAGGALNNGLISYSAGRAQYVAAAVGGATENPSTVAGALRVVVYGLHGNDKPTIVTRELSDTLHHLTNEHLVLWAWNPGTRPNGEQRTTPPIDHETFVKEFAQWMNNGAPCPSN